MREQAFVVNCHEVGRRSSGGTLAKHEIQGKCITVFSGRKQFGSISLDSKSLEMLKKKISYSEVSFVSNYPYILKGYLTFNFHASLPLCVFDSVDASSAPVLARCFAGLCGE